MISGVSGNDTLNYGMLSSSAAQLQSDEGKIKSFEETLELAMKNDDDEELLEACREFESYFIQMMFKAMRSTVDTSGGLIPESNATNIFQSMLDEQYSMEASKGKGLGLAESLYKQMKRQTVDDLEQLY